MNNNQRDPRWENIPVGTGEQTIGQIGCTISVIGNILGLTPDVVNEKLKSLPPRGDQGFTGYAYQNLVYWERLKEAFPEFIFKRVWSYNNDEVLANVPNVIVEAPATSIGGRGSHWTNYIGNKQCKDPWTGTIRPTSDFPDPTGYCIITPIPVVLTPLPEPNPGYPPTQPNQDVEKNGIHYHSSDGKVWEIIPKPPQTPEIPLQPQNQPNTPTLPQNPSISYPATSRSPLNNLLDMLKNILVSFLKLIKLKK